MVPWSEHALQSLPRSGGVRLRGRDMTRLETFCDAAFAFATTLLVISSDGIPRGLDELLRALKGAPAFAASFAIIASSWVSHRRWSRRYGLEDGASTLISLGLIFVMLVYVYPLKMVMEAFFSWATVGWLPSRFTLGSTEELRGLFIVYGIGGLAQTGMFALLNVRAAASADALGLDAVERLRTREEIVSFSVMAVTCLASTIWAATLPLSIAVYAGFAYPTLSITMPLVATIHARKAAALEAERPG